MDGHSNGRSAGRGRRAQGSYDTSSYPRWEDEKRGYPTSRNLPVAPGELRFAHKSSLSSPQRNGQAFDGNEGHTNMYSIGSRVHPDVARRQQLTLLHRRDSPRRTQTTSVSVISRNMQHSAKDLAKIKRDNDFFKTWKSPMTLDEVIARTPKDTMRWYRHVWRSLGIDPNKNMFTDILRIYQIEDPRFSHPSWKTFNRALRIGRWPNPGQSVQEYLTPTQEDLDEMKLDTHGKQPKLSQPNCGLHAPLDIIYQQCLLTPRDHEMASRQKHYNSLSESHRKEQEEWAQEQLRPQGPASEFACPNDFGFYRIPFGYRCYGSQHMITDELLAEGKGGYYVTFTGPMFGHHPKETPKWKGPMYGKYNIMAPSPVIHGGYKSRGRQ